MVDVPTDPLIYLTPPAPSFWKWSEEGQVATWFHGETIVFRPELEHILHSLGNDGLPPLSLVLLVLAACRDSFRDALSHMENLAQMTAGLDNPDLPLQRKLLDGLMSITQLPPERRHPIEAKVSLVEMLFETATPRTSPERASVICKKLYLGSLTTIPEKRQPRQHGIPEGLKSLLEGLGRFDEETFTLRHATGLDQILQPAAIEPKQGDQARSLISLLQEDWQFQGLARLARDLMAVVHVPRPLLDPEELPMGGYSDIANRGPLDRLLVSELAHDPLTLAVRVALNEALYVRRENPRKTPPHSRAILIDAGIRLWGVPRLFATAAAMAMAATADRHVGILTFRAKGDRIERADLTTRPGLVRHLEALEPDVHPGPALDKFLATARGDNADADCIIVTSADAAADPDFQKSLARHRRNGLYLATVNRTGEFRLVREGPHGRKSVCEADLVLDELLRPSCVPALPLMEHAKDVNLPAIFREERFPLRIPHNAFKPWRSWSVPECGVFEITSDRRLVLWDELGHGPRQVADFVPSKSHVSWNDPELRDGKSTVVLGQPEDASIRLVSVEPATGNVEVMQLELDCTPYAISGHGGFLIAIGRQEARILSLVDGRCVEKIPLANRCRSEIGASYERGRFFCNRDTGTWYALTYDGRQAHFEKVFDSQMHGNLDLASMIDWVGHEGPVAVTRRGELYFPEEKRLQKPANPLEGPIRVAMASPCGKWISIPDDGNQTPRTFERYLNVSSGRTERKYGGIKSLQRDEFVRPATGHLHRGYSAVAGTVAGLCLLSRKGSWWKIAPEEGNLRLRHIDASGVVLAQPCSLSSHVSLHHGGYGLNHGRWSDGSQAFLDSRCLLHLRSADSNIPEATLVLADAEVAGWCSDGRMWGSSYFVGDHANADPCKVFEEVIQPFIHHVRRSN